MIIEVHNQLLPGGPNENINAKQLTIMHYSISDIGVQAYNVLQVLLS